MKVGDVYQANDPRSPDRQFRILEIGVQKVLIENVRTKRRTRLAIDRFRPELKGTKGFRPVGP